MKKINLTKKQMIIAGIGAAAGALGIVLGVKKVKDSKQADAPEESEEASE